jgi:hypothetical protein
VRLLHNLVALIIAVGSLAIANAAENAAYATKTNRAPNILLILADDK